ncbi:MAG TPA: hypothetical protein VGJ74_21450 [Burkholderiales bacterium]|jgi:hypothetical protein
MNARLIRKVALSLAALLLFAQASFVLSACQRDRASLAHMMMSPATEEGCGDCETVVGHNDALYANRCFAHCTADLQLAGLPIALVRSAADAPVLFVPRTVAHSPPDTGLDGAPPGAPPRRILLHSFLV